MREVIVTVGTRASGKSSFCQRVIAADPSIVYISRDNILIELFGRTSLDPYSGGHFYAYEKMWEVVKEKLIQEEVRIILDVWNGSAGERRSIIKQLREHGADQVMAWYFTTPVKFVEEWFWQKPGIAKIDEIRDRQGEGLVFYCEDAPRRDHKLFHHLASDIDLDGFDAVIRVNPITMGPEHVVHSQTSLNL